MTTAAALRESVEERLSRELTDLLDHPGGLGLSAHCDRLDRALLELRAIAEFSAQDIAVVISVDLCELIDWSITSARHIQRFESLRKRRVLTDIAYARKAMDICLQGNLLLTILPGTASEVVHHLRVVYSENARYLRLLAEGLPRTEEATRELMGYAGCSSFLSRLLQGRHSVIAEVDQLVSLVRRLFSLDAFIQPHEELRPAIDGLDLDLVIAIESALTGLRSRGGENSRIDAINLAVTAKVPEVLPGFAVLHMTRTPTLHALPRSGVTLEFAVTRNRVGGGHYPLLIRPETICLLGYLFPGGRPGADAVEKVEDFARAWGEYSSYCRVLEFSRGPLKRMKALERLRTARIDREYYGVLASWFSLLRDGAAIGSQMRLLESTSGVIDEGMQERAAAEEAAMARLLEQQEAVMQLFSVVQHWTGLNLPTGARSLLPPEASSPLTDSDSFGLETDCRCVSDGLEEILLRDRLRRSLGNGEYEGVLFGLARSTVSQEFQRAFWPSQRSAEFFLAAVTDLIREQGGDLLVVAKGLSGRLGYVDISALSFDAESVLRQLSCAPVEVLHLETEFLEIVAEFGNSFGRQPLCSLRSPVQFGSRVVELYSSTGGVLPRLLLTNFLARQGVQTDGTAKPEEFN
jgi:hypothetical protein